MDFKKRWFDFCACLNLNNNLDIVWGWIEKAYSEKTRYYHNLKHLEDCFNEFDYITKWNSEVEFAIWFHDIVYDSQQFDNEENSAKIAKNALTLLGCNAKLIDSVNDIILHSKNHAQTLEENKMLFSDIDLSIFGKDEEVFLKYEENIREEYGWVPTDIYTKKRINILNSFMMRNSIYNLPDFKGKYEKQARYNITKLVSKLKDQVHNP